MSVSTRCGTSTDVAKSSSGVVSSGFNMAVWALCAIGASGVLLFFDKDEASTDVAVSSSGVVVSNGFDMTSTDVAMSSSGIVVSSGFNMAVWAWCPT